MPTLHLLWLILYIFSLFGIKYYSISQIKFAVDRSLDAIKYEDADIGQNLLRVLKFWTMTNKFNGVHPALAKIGVTRVEVAENGLAFLGNIK